MQPTTSELMLQSLTQWSESRSNATKGTLRLVGKENEKKIEFVPSNAKLSLLERLQRYFGTGEFSLKAISTYVAGTKNEQIIEKFYSTCQKSNKIQKLLDPTKQVLKAYQEARKQGAPKAELDLIVSNTKVLLKNPQANPEKIRKDACQAILELTKASKNATAVGNKAANLQRLKEIFSDSPDISIPDFQGIPHETIFKWIKEKFPTFNKKWNTFQQMIRKGKSLEQCSSILGEIQNEIRQAFETTTFQIDSQLTAGTSPLMVRSTGKEDSLQVANPGGNESVANVKADTESISKAMGTVVASYFSPKSLGQRKAVGDDITQPPFMPVLVQVMAKTPTSGVMYTTEAEGNTPGVTQISAAFGHAEDVVTGSAPSDLFYVQAQGEVIHGIIREKPTKKIPGEHGLETVQNAPKDRMRSSLPKEALLKLAQAGKKLEEAYGYPMDVEWSYDPQTDKLFIFQARPIPQKTRPEPSHIRPDKIGTLNNLTQVTVIGAGGGSVLVLNATNTIRAESAPDALTQYLAAMEKDPSSRPKAILLRKTTATNSHEAGFFRERGIPVIHVGEQLSQLEGTLKTDQMLLDTQEELIGSVPSGVNPSDLIEKGLRRHLAPKMESSFIEPDEASLETLINFSKSLKTIAEQADVQTTDTLIKNTFGRNALDKLLNAYELATSREAKAYILHKTLLQLTKTKRLSQLTLTQRKTLFRKIYQNSYYLWEATSRPDSTELQQKFAMNWLRAAVLQRPADGVLDADTLYVALGEVKERTAQNLQPNEGLLDIFQRSAKFAINIENRNAWKNFICSLSEKELAKLGQLFKSLGPSVVEVWINTIFPETYKKCSGDNQAQSCLTSLIQQANDPTFKQAIIFTQEAHKVTSDLLAVTSEFADPSKFDSAFLKLESLTKKASECIEKMKTARGFEGTLLAHAFRQMVDAYDNSIKALTSSALYQTNLRQKANRFHQMLKGYFTLGTGMLSPQVLQDEVLKTQANWLSDYLYRASGFNQSASDPYTNTSDEEINKSLNATPGFNVGLAALGSNCTITERAFSMATNIPVRIDQNKIQGRPARGTSLQMSLEDLFTTLHQSMITATARVEHRSGMKETSLPQELQTICASIKSLTLDRAGAQQPTIQSIEYHYPNISVRFNCPLRNHSAQFEILTTVEPDGSIKNMDFIGTFYCPFIEAKFDERSLTLDVYALSVPYQSNAFILPKDMSLSSTPGTTRFQWRLPKQLRPEQLSSALQPMIDYLQQAQQADPSKIQFDEEILRANPELLRQNLSQERLTKLQILNREEARKVQNALLHP